MREGGDVGVAESDVIEEHNSISIAKGRRDQTPHALIASVAMCKEDGLSVRWAENMDIVPQCDGVGQR
jgi:hypothetical protein